LSPGKLSRKKVVAPSLPRNDPMHDSPGCIPTTTPRPADLAHRLHVHLAALVALVHEYHAQPLTPTATFAFEKKSRTGCGRPGGR